MIKISLVIPVYNTEKYIEKCIASCLSQNIDEEDFEIIIVNDGSKDNSLSIVEGMQSLYNNIVIVSQNNKGLSGARNTGLRRAKGQYVWFIDSDDWIEENCLKKVVDICLTKDLDILQVCAANILNGMPVRRFHRNNTTDVMTGLVCLKHRFPFCVPFSIYRKDFLLNNDLWFYEGIFHEDNDFTPRVYSKAVKVYAIDDILYYVYQNPQSITRTINPKKSLDCITVMNRLADFQKSLNKEDKQSFDNIITLTMNVALRDASFLSIQDKIVFSNMLYDNKHLFRHLWNAFSWVYKVEAVLLMMFPQKPIGVYRFLNFFDKRSIKGKEV